MTAQSPIKAVFLDLGDVCFTWNSGLVGTIPGKGVRDFLSTQIWEAYDCSIISQDVCFQQLSGRFGVPKRLIAREFSMAKSSMRRNESFVPFMSKLKRSSMNSIKVYAMSNISKEDLAFLSPQMEEWGLFDDIFASGHVGFRKPDVRFFDKVLCSTGLEPQEAVLVDDKATNIMAARSIGMNGILFNDGLTAKTALNTACDSPILRAYRHLHEIKPTGFKSFLEVGLDVSDNFAQLLIREVTGDDDLVPYQWGSRSTWNFFIGAGAPVDVPGGNFPDDLDTTSLALTALRPKDEIVQTLLDRMATFVNDDGSIQTYFERKRARTDYIVSANVLACFYTFGRGAELASTLQQVYNSLAQCKYENGTRYYVSPDCCLFFYARLLRSSDDEVLQGTLAKMTRCRVRERLGLPGSALDLSMRTLAAGSVDLETRYEKSCLLSLQNPDGSWDPGWMYRYGSTGARLRNDAVTTAFAASALAS